MQRSNRACADGVALMVLALNVVWMPATRVCMPSACSNDERTKIFYGGGGSGERTLAPCGGGVPTYQTKLEPSLGSSTPPV